MIYLTTNCHWIATYSFLVESKSFLEAVKAVADYEQALVKLYPAQTFEMGLFQNEAHHLSLHSSFDDWTPESLKKLELPDWLPAMGFDVLLALKGRHDEDKLLLMSFDMGKLERRIGLKSQKSIDTSTDQQLMLFAQMTAANFGAVSGK